MAKKCFNLLLAPIALGLNLEVNASDNLYATQVENENPPADATNLPIDNAQPNSQQNTSTQSINEAFGTYKEQQPQNVEQTRYISNTSDTELVNKMFASQEQSQGKDSEIVNNMFDQNSQVSHQIPMQQKTTEIQSNSSQNNNETYMDKTSEEPHSKNYQSQIMNNISAGNFQDENERFTLQPQSLQLQNHEIAKENASDFIVKQAQDKITISDSAPNSLQHDIKEINEKIKIINEDISNIKENIGILTVALAESKTSSLSQEKISEKEYESDTTSIDNQRNVNNNYDTDTEQKIEEQENAITTENEDVQNPAEINENASSNNDTSKQDSDNNDIPQEKVNDDLSLILKEIKKVKDKVDNLDDKVDNLSQNGDTNILTSSQQKENHDELKKKINNTESYYDEQSQNVSTVPLSRNQESDFESNENLIDENVINNNVGDENIDDENEQNIAKKKITHNKYDVLEPNNTDAFSIVQETSHKKTISENSNGQNKIASKSDEDLQIEHVNEEKFIANQHIPDQHIDDKPQDTKSSDELEVQKDSNEAFALESQKDNNKGANELEALKSDNNNEVSSGTNDDFTKQFVPNQKQIIDQETSKNMNQISTLTSEIKTIADTASLINQGLYNQQK